MKKPKQPRQCVVCGFNATRCLKLGPDRFVCQACVNENAEESSRRYEDEEYLEISRLEQSVRYNHY